MNDKQVIYDIIETDIMDCFDFKKVKDIMDHMDWTWYGTEGVPQIWEIRQKARQLLRDAYHGLLSEDTYPEYTTGTGGLVATAYRDSIVDTVYFKLQFVLEAWDNLD